MIVMSRACLFVVIVDHSASYEIIIIKLNDNKALNKVLIITLDMLKFAI